MIGLVNWLLHGTRKRTDSLPTPFPDAWRTTLDRDCPFVRRLPTADDREQLERDVFWFIEQRTWTPIDIEIDNRKKVIVAAFACLLINRRLDLPVYPRTREIIIRPSAFGKHTDAIAPDGTVHDIWDPRLGEAWYRGPIVLAWDSVEPLTRSPTAAHNVVIHECAHKLDFLDGHLDGTPPLESRQELQTWARTFSREFEILRQLTDRKQRSDIDPYGAQNEAEFFAVVTEQFFSRPQVLRGKHPGLYDQLKRFYAQDPAATY